MPESFGARLRRRRERQHIALSTIAEHTKIKQSLLEALERDDVSHWPIGIFRRAFVRAYAQAIGLDPDIVVREFLELHPDPTEAIEPVAEFAAAADVNGRSRPPTRMRYIVGAAVGSLFGRKDAVSDTARALRTDGPAHSASAGGARPAAIASDPDLVATAQLCTAIARADRANEMRPLLQEAARILDAIGIIVWAWDPSADALRPGASYGYSDQVLAHLPPVGRDASNATAAAFRSAQVCAVDGGGHASGALVVPLMAPPGCVGVLAIELPDGAEHRNAVRALATIVAAPLARTVASAKA